MLDPPNSLDGATGQGGATKAPGKNDPEQLYELIFIHPTGKETSANAPPFVARGTTG